jgi:serine/threonine protein phosphatase PrpC
MHLHALAHRSAGCGPLQALGAAFLSTEQQLRRSGAALGSGTCVVAAVLTAEELHLAHVGDCRAVALIGGRCEELTRDHKATDKFERARIRRAGGAVIGGRLMAVLAVSRSIGDYRLKPEPPSPKEVRRRMRAQHDALRARRGGGLRRFGRKPTWVEDDGRRRGERPRRRGRRRRRSIERREETEGRAADPEGDPGTAAVDGGCLIATPELATFRLRDDDGDCELLVLASDGVWDVLRSEDVMQLVAAALDEPGGTPDSAAEELVMLARAEGSTDDLTAVVAQLRPPPGRASKEKGAMIGRRDTAELRAAWRVGSHAGAGVSGAQA